jgi:hypothetical protein
LLVFALQSRNLRDFAKKYHNVTALQSADMQTAAVGTRLFYGGAGRGGGGEIAEVKELDSSTGSH